MVNHSPGAIFVIGLLLLALLPCAVIGVEEDFKSQLPRIAPTEAADALKTFQILPGFRLELVASEPNVVDPIAMSFDEHGRLFVIEMRGYSEDGDKNLGRVRLLEDRDSDGRYEKASVFMEGLSWPTAIVCFDGGVFIAAAPDIWWAKDTSGDGKADIRKRVFTGFGRGNVQGLVNTLHWGLDNRIHGATSSSGGSVKRVYDASIAAVSLRGRDFAFDPRALKLEATSGGAQHGLSFDDWGRKFVCSNSDHLQVVMFEDRYAARNPYQAAPRSRLSIAADGGQAPVFRISPIEPWRIVRTRLRVAGKVRGPIEGGGKPAGYFTGSTGVTIYRGDALPDEYRGMAFIGDVGSNIVHRKRIEARGVAFIGKRVDDKREFLASKDIWFRPVQFANGPDGGLYIADMYREVIEHPKSLPPMIKKHLDLTSGRDRGRIYRVVPQGFKRPKPFRASDMTTAMWVKLLEHPNGWVRDTAARMIYQRQDKAAVEPLKKLAIGSSIPQARIHALYALDGLGAVDNQVVLAGLSAKHPRVREHAIRLIEKLDSPADRVLGALPELAHDKDPRVRYQVAFTLGQVENSMRQRVLAHLLKRYADDPWMRFAVVSSLERGAGEVVSLLTADPPFRRSKIGRQVMTVLAEQVGRQQRKDQIESIQQAIRSLEKAKGATDEDRKTTGLVTAALKRGSGKARLVAKSPKVNVPDIKAQQARRAERKKVIEAYRPALQLSGDGGKGKQLFAEHCATCHQMEGVGNAFGPNLAAMANRGAEAIFVNVLDPNAEVNPQYQAYAVSTNDGQQFAGMIVAETATSLNLVQADGKTVSFLRIDIARITPTGLSLMPEGLEKSLNQQALADLMAYLLGAR